MANRTAGERDGISVVFASLSDPTRREILERLARDGEMTVGEIARPYAVALPTISKHLKVLERADLIRRERQGKTIVVSVNPAPLQSALDYLAYHRVFWRRQLDRLEQYIERQVRKDG